MMRRPKGFSITCPQRIGLVPGIVALLLVLVLLLPCLAAGATSTTLPSSAAGQAASASTSVTVPAAPAVAAPAAILVNADDGRVLCEKNADQKRAMASTTKIMTGLLALENLDPSVTVTVSALAADAGESEMLLEEGEEIGVEELLYGLMVMSGNDAAVALAEAVAGDVSSFVDMMNSRGEELGLTGTHFVSPHGLDAEGHYSTARDLARLGTYAMTSPGFARLVGTAKIEFPWPGHSEKRVMINHNKLVGSVSYITGIKTGFTNNAGYCLVASGSKNGVNLVSVVMGAASNDACNQDTLKLMDYGFSLYQQEVLAEAGAVFATMPIPYQSEQQLPLVAESTLVRPVHVADEVSKSVYVPPRLPIPVEQGTALGLVTFSAGDQQIASVALIAAESVPRPTLGVKLTYFWTQLRDWVGGLFP